MGTIIYREQMCRRSQRLKAQSSCPGTGLSLPAPSTVSLLPMTGATGALGEPLHGGVLVSGTFASSMLTLYCDLFF